VQINFAHLCDYALVSKDGKLSVIGIFSGIVVRDLPATHPRSFLAFEIELKPAEVNRPVKVRIDCVNADGGQLFSAALEMKIEGPGRIRDRPRFSQVVGIDNLHFVQSGDYNFNFWLNENLAFELAFEVKVAAPPAAPPVQVSSPPEPSE
jgi:hypothetical protein